MCRVSHLFVTLLIFSLCSYSIISRAEYPGVTAGSFSVSNSGSANYVLPISTPAGVAGMSPELAISYGSQGGNGLLGVGFSLSGFTSLIHRCGGSHAVDGKATGVTYTNTDKLCLNGQRLILSSGTHFNNGAVYRTEIDSFSKIVYKTSPVDHFEIYTKDGEILEFSTRSRVSTSYTLRWYLTSERDRSGNSIYYFYRHDLNGETWLPDKVTWGANDPGLANREAVFEYELRPDKRFSYDQGFKRQRNNRIKSIKTYIDNNLIKDYRFTYEESPVSGLSRLRYAQQCGFDGGCLPQHEFEWNDTLKGFDQNTAYELPVRVYDNRDIWQGDSCSGCNDGYIVEEKHGDFVDVNNDGYVDFIQSYRDENSSTQYRKFYQNTGSGWSLRSNQPPILIRDYYINRNKSPAKGEMVQQAIYADVNGDGYPDIVRAFINGSTNIREVRLNNKGNSFTWGAPSENNFVPPSRMFDYNYLGEGKAMQASYLIDVNGDGLPDWVISYLNKDGVNVRYTYINNGTRWVYDQNYNLPTTAILDDYRDSQELDGAPVKRTEFQDLNGDGLPDLVQGLISPDQGVDNGVTYRNVWLNTGSGWQVATSTYQLPDYIYDYTRVNEIINGQAQNDSAQRRGDFVDVNGDGLADWVRSYRDFLNGTAYKATWLNTGNGWVADTGYNLPAETLRNYRKQYKGDPHGPEAGSFFDINRDGLVDWMIAHKNRDNETIRRTYLNTGQGWIQDNSFLFPDILVDNVLNEDNVPMHFGGIMDLNADGAPDYLMSTTPLFGSDIVKTYLGRAKPADMVVKVIDSLNAETTISYKSMMDKTVYNFYPSWLTEPESFRQRKVIGPIPLVSDTWQTDGLGGNYQLQYFYYNALSDGKRGYQGFSQRRIWNPQQGILTVSNFYQQFPVTGMSKLDYIQHAESINANGAVDTSQPYQLLSHNSNFLEYVDNFTEQGEISETIGRITHSSGKYTYAPKIYRTRSMEYELGQTSAIRSIWTNFVYDDYSNPISIRIITVPGATVISTNQDLTNHFHTLTQTTFDNNENDWLIGLATDVKVTHHAPGQIDQIRETQLVYNSIGLLTQTVVEPNKPEFMITTDHSYDNFGNAISSTISGQGIEPRISTITYDQQGMHAIAQTNALDHSVSVVPHPRCDAPQSTTDANGLVIQITYDEFCRKIRTDYPDGTWSTTDFLSSSLSIIGRAKGQPDVTTYFDSLGRDIKVETKGFDGRTVIAEKRYNNKGQITQESFPYYESETIYWTEYYYDAIGRLSETKAPDNSTRSINYNGLTTAITNPLGQTQTRIVDILSRLKSVIDAQGNMLTYNYDAVGNLLSTADPLGNQVTMGYDHAGRKIWMDDPDMGYWAYEYDVLGQLTVQVDAKEQMITNEYDKLGRITRRVVQPGTVDEQISTWRYDTAANGLGRLDQTNGSNGYQRRHTYDTLSRPKYTFEIIDGIQMTSSQYYNADGKISEVRYPGRNVDGIPGKADRIKYSYNTNGYLSRVYDIHQLDGQSITEDLWVAEAMDARGNVTVERYSNGVSVSRQYHSIRNFLLNINSFLENDCPPDQRSCENQYQTIQDLTYWYDAIGNLTGRRDDVLGTNENFIYDDLNRLAQSITTPPAHVGPQFTINYDYDVLGNLTYRSDVGIMNYGENGYGPHAITSIQQNSSVNVTENVFNPYGNYNYDGNGNLTSNGQRTVDWTAFNKPKQMAAVIDGEARGVSYTYGSNFQRVTKSTLSGKTTRYYGGGSMEHITDGSDIFWKYYIPVGATTLEIKYQQAGSQSAGNFTQVEKQYLLKDHLGSTDVIVDDDGNIVERLSFNPWGERRNTDWTEADNEITSSTNRGFTGHEMDDEIGLVNMNARIYDPVIGRFLSPDVIIPSATDLQAYNRYAYVRNNPLSFTDPTGHFWTTTSFSPANGYKQVNVACGSCKTVNKQIGGDIIKFPGNRGGYSPTLGYVRHTSTWVGPWETGGGRGTGYYQPGLERVTDPAQIAAINTHLQVGSEIVQNYGGLSRGNTKETRNKYRAQARAILGCKECSWEFVLSHRGHSAEFDAVLDKAHAAGEIYKALKSKARSRYAFTASTIVASAVAGWGTFLANGGFAGGKAAIIAAGTTVSRSNALVGLATGSAASGVDLIASVAGLNASLPGIIGKAGLKSFVGISSGQVGVGFGIDLISLHAPKGNENCNVVCTYDGQGEFADAVDSFCSDSTAADACHVSVTGSNPPSSSKTVPKFWHPMCTAVVTICGVKSGGDKIIDILYPTIPNEPIDWTPIGSINYK